jgi:hypothetical protein
MLYEAINCIKTELRRVIPTADIGNINDIVSGTGNTTNDPPILISLINIEENRISRDPKNYIQAGFTNTVKESGCALKPYAFIYCPYVCKEVMNSH